MRICAYETHVTCRFRMNLLGERFGPSFEEGRCADQTNAALPPHRRGGGQAIAARVKSDLPGRADTKVTPHLLRRHGHPSSKASKEGRKRRFVIEPILQSSAF
jgi:hypothetical protein